MSQPILVKHTFPVPAERLFAALDDHATMGRWLGAKVDLIKSPPDKGVGSVRRLHLGPKKIDEEVIEREVPKRIVYTIVRGLAPLSYHRGEINVTSLGPQRSSVEWQIALDSNVPGLARVVRAGLGFAMKRGLERLDRRLSAS